MTSDETTNDDDFTPDGSAPDGLAPGGSVPDAGPLPAPVPRSSATRRRPSSARWVR
ncbi:hypothetical protein ID875_28270 [Streptomyces globisporus]|uniref:Uncharacterized protein n=1 Tax=Streptomyces globisporus TaxID=1908 RepID=A0A927BPN3_STRGL|nr:hypothetical protein [Streptomyces globisporus]